MALSASTWVPVGQIGLNQGITDISTTKLHPLGERIRCRDTSSNARGEGEFQYARGVASVAAGDLAAAARACKARCDSSSPFSWSSFWSTSFVSPS